MNKPSVLRAETIRQILEEDKVEHHRAEIAKAILDDALPAPLVSTVLPKE